MGRLLIAVLVVVLGADICLADPPLGLPSSIPINITGYPLGSQTVVWDGAHVPARWYWSDGNDSSFDLRYDGTPPSPGPWTLQAVHEFSNFALFLGDSLEDDAWVLEDSEGTGGTWQFSGGDVPELSTAGLFFSAWLPMLLSRSRRQSSSVNLSASC